LIDVENDKDIERRDNLYKEINEKQSNKILQNILQASKLFEGRFTYSEIASMDIPNFEALVENEFANIDLSYKNFKDKGIVNAYTRNETSFNKNGDGQLLNELGNSIRSQ